MQQKDEYPMPQAGSQSEQRFQEAESIRPTYENVGLFLVEVMKWLEEEGR